MATLSDVKAGIDLIAKYFDDDEVCEISTSDDFLVISGPISLISNEDAARLESLGWECNEGAGDWGIDLSI